MRPDGLDAQDLGEPRRGSSACGECSSYRGPAPSNVYSATALVISLPYASSASSAAASREVGVTVSSGADSGDREVVTGDAVISDPPANARAATATRPSTIAFTSTAST